MALPRITSVLVLVAIACGSTGGAAGPSVRSDPTVQSNLADLGPRVDFSIELFDGTSFAVESHIVTDGRPVLLNLWASWCVPCRREMPLLQSASVEHPNVLFLGVAIDDSVPRAKQFARDLGITFPVGADSEDEVATALEFPGLPTTFLISAEGRLTISQPGELTAERLDEVLAIAG